MKNSHGVFNKICIVTAARSEYGLLRWLIDSVHTDSALALQLIVTGSHLSDTFGNTVAEIESDGYPIAQKVDMQLSVDTQSAIAKSMGKCAIGMADAFESLNPDVVVVLGDRYELLPICSTALMMNIPIAHISGGDITEGAIDEQIRNAVTMMATLHFPGVQESADNIARMTNSAKNIFVAGEPGLDNFNRLELWSRAQLAGSLGLDPAKKWILVTQHPETKESPERNSEFARNIVAALAHDDGIEVIITKANADFGGEQINRYFEDIAAKSSKYQLYSSLGQERYLSLMREAYCVIGNSSSGIVEAPYLAKPVINIGNRQKGRYYSSNVLSVSGLENSIGEAYKKIDSDEFKENLVPEYYFGNGETSAVIIQQIKNFLNA